MQYFSLSIRIQICARKCILQIRFKYSSLRFALFNAPDNILRDFIKDKFTVLEKNLNHTSFRKTFEGLLITLKKPELNIQKSHKCQTFLCTCVIPDDSIT